VPASPGEPSEQFDPDSARGLRSRLNIATISENRPSEMPTADEALGSRDRRHSFISYTSQESSEAANPPVPFPPSKILTSMRTPGTPLASFLSPSGRASSEKEKMSLSPSLLSAEFGFFNQPTTPSSHPSQRANVIDQALVEAGAALQDEQDKKTKQFIAQSIRRDLRFNMRHTPYNEQATDSKDPILRMPLQEGDFECTPRVMEVTERSTASNVVLATLQIARRQSAMLHVAMPAQGEGHTSDQFAKVPKNSHQNAAVAAGGVRNVPLVRVRSDENIVSAEQPDSKAENVLQTLPSIPVSTPRNDPGQPTRDAIRQYKSLTPHRFWETRMESK